ncbi:outer membrane protein assembly factor BamA [bacterium]|nr:MAG: outer membrane protein assembly factor BamA [bacterium]
MIWILALFPYGEVIVDVCVKGVERTDTSLVISASGLRIGEIMTERKSARAIKNVYALGLFSDVRLEAEREGGGARIWIVVKENPMLLEWKLEGVKKIKEKELKKKIKLIEGQIISEKDIFDAVRNIKEIYKEKGFHGTEVEVRKEELEGAVKVTFVVHEGRKLRVKKIKFYGNESIPEKKLKKLLTNHEKNWWRRGNLNEEAVEEDVKKIEDYYREHGFPEARVDSFKINEIEEGWVEIDYWVSEGKKYYFGDAVLEGMEKIPEDILRKKIKWKKGEIFNRKKFEETIRDMYSVYSDRGYLYANIFPEEMIKKDTINVIFRIQEGSPVYVRFIDIKGNTKTFDKVIRRELLIYPGDLFNREKLIESQYRLFRLGYFEDIKVDMRQHEDSVDLVLTVKEKQTGSFSAGASYSEDIGLALNLSLSVPNFLGRGQLVRLTVQRGKKIKDYSFGFLEPYLFDVPTSVGFDLFNTYRTYDYYEYGEIGGRIRLGKRLYTPKDYRISATYTLEEVKVVLGENVDTSSISPWIRSQAHEGWQWKSSISFSIVRDSRNTYMGASRGSYTEFLPEFAGGWLGGEIAYQKYVLEQRWFAEFLPSWVAVVRYRIGILAGIGGKEPPLNEWFVPGGSGVWGVRGYPDRSIGQAEGGWVIGGKSAFVFTFEIHRNISKTAYALAFFDAGGAFPSFLDAKFSDLKRGVGIGIRIELPMMGIMGFDLGYGIDAKEEKWQPHFQLGFVL